MDEFWILFIPILLIGVAALYFGITTPINFFINVGLVVLGIICAAIDVFAALVQYVNWKYYKEK